MEQARQFPDGATEVAAEFSYRIRPHLLRQVYAVESVDFITGSADDFTPSTVATFSVDP
jgi:hypothetical protein